MFSVIRSSLKSSRVSALCRVRGGRTARKFRKGCTVLCGHPEITENYQYCIAVPTTFVQYCKLLQIIDHSSHWSVVLQGFCCCTGSSGSFIFQIEEHLEKECPNTEIKCPFHIVGCTFKVWQLFMIKKKILWLLLNRSMLIDPTVTKTFKFLFVKSKEICSTMQKVCQRLTL